MKERNPIAVVLLPLITLGIYSLYWSVSTKTELNKNLSDEHRIPTAWLLVVPFVNWWWMWKYSFGVEKQTGEKCSQVMAFVLQFLLGSIGQAIIQNFYNKHKI